MTRWPLNKSLGQAWLNWNNCLGERIIEMAKKLTDQVALVTGGSEGIGRGIAEKFAQEGAHVFILGRHEATLKKVADSNAKIDYIVADLTKDEDVQHVAQVIKKQAGKLNILVNNAGWCPVQPLADMTIADYDKAYSLDVWGVVNMTINVLPLLQKANGANIINMSSVGAHNLAPNFSMYASAKMAIEVMTKTWAMELAKDKIRVNAIAPGPIDTSIWYKTDLSRAEEEQNKQNMINQVPVHRLGKPADIANGAAYLVSDEASYVTGIVLTIDGGQGL